jgi:hypothetical protein
MKTNRHSESGLLNPRVFTAFLLCVTGALLAILGFAASALSQGTSRTPSYLVGNFRFSAPQELTGHPPSPLFFQQDAEPEIAVDIFGNIYVTAIQGVPGGTDFWKSTTKGASFVYLGQPDGAQDHCNPPVVQCVAAGGGDDQIDVSPGGYLYISSLWLGNVTMSASYDGGTGGTIPGQAWAVDPAAADIVSDDRQWVAAYGPRTVYMSFATTALTRPPGSVGLFMTKSTDGGQTFLPTSLVEITATTPLDQVNVESNLVVDPYNGNLYTAYIPNATKNVIKLASSTDGGMTWNITTAFTGPVGTTNRGVFPNLAVDRGGNLHMVFTNSIPANSPGNPNPFRINAHVFLTSTANPADPNPTWLPAVQVDSAAVDPDTRTACEAWVVAGSPGTVNIAWLGTKEISTDQQPAVPPNPAITPTWHIFFAQTKNAMSANPTFAQNKVESQIIHNHSICFDGAGCTGGPHGDPGNRDLLEYFKMTLDPEGNANIAYADSVNNCDPNVCITNAWFAKQKSGPSAYHPPAAPKLATFAPNVSLPLSSAGDSPAEPNMKADSHNCLFSASPGRPDDWKSIDDGAGFFLLPNPVADETGVTGGDEDILPFAQPSGARPDALYFADLGVTSVHIRKSIDGGATWFAPGPMGAAGEVSASVDRQWLSGDRSGTNQTIYLWEHEFVTEELRMSALVNDTAWSAPALGLTDPELSVPPQSTLPNTNVAPTFVDPATHTVYGFFCGSTTTSNAIGGGFGKLPNVWEADGPGTFTPGVPPGTFDPATMRFKLTNHPVFKGVVDSPTTSTPPVPAGAQTFGANTGNLFSGAAIDKAGNIYVTWSTPSARTNNYDVWFASSHDHGKTYYGPFRVSQNGTQGTMPWIAAGDSGRIDIVYYGTTGTESPNTSTTDQWNVFMAQSLNAAGREPVFTASQASDHIMHVGPICNVGILCGGGTRQLLDFFQVAIGPDGLANIAYADDGASNGPTHISYARQSGGPLALKNPVGFVCEPPVVTVSASPTQIHEGQGSAYTISASPAPAQPLTVSYKMSGTASLGGGPGYDYSLSGTVGQVTIPAGQSSATVMLTSNQDPDEGPSKEPAKGETAIMTLQPGPAVVVGTPGVATVNILP